MTRVVIESPCAGTDINTFEDHREYLRRCLLDSLERGEAPIASHGLFAFTGFLDDRIPFQRKLGMEAGWSWIAVAERLVVYTDLGVSPGMQRAIDHATSLSIPVEMRSIGTGDQNNIGRGAIPEVDGHCHPAP